MVKVSVLGDIMCEGPFLQAAENSDGTFSFSKAFLGLKELLEESDYVIGNLETPFAGPEAGYTITEDMYSFNTPDDFAIAVQDMGVDLALTANNHCYDRGEKGLLRTLEVLDACGLNHTGTYRSPEEAAPFRIQIQDTELVVISCTASTNAELTKQKTDLTHINLLDEQFTKYPSDDRVALAKRFIVKRVIGLRNYMRLRRLMGKPPQNPTVDNRLDKERVEPYLARIEAQIQNAKAQGALVFVCPHMGGQFNVHPGKFSEYVMCRLTAAGADAVVASHPHIIQKEELIATVPCFFSLGNISMSMSTEYLQREHLPDVGLVAHFYISGDRIIKVTGSLVKMIEEENHYLVVRDFYELYTSSTEDEKEKLTSEWKQIMDRLKPEGCNSGPCREIDLFQRQA